MSSFMMFCKSVILLGQFVRIYTSQIVNSSSRILKIGSDRSNSRHLLNIMEVFWIGHLFLFVLKGWMVQPQPPLLFNTNIQIA
jgi:hypothetical protein